MSHRSSVVFTDKVYNYLSKASADEDRSMGDIIMEAIRLRERIKAGEFYVLQEGEFVRVMVL